MNPVPRIEEPLLRNPEFREMAYIFANDLKVLHDYHSLTRHSDYEMLRVGGVIRRLLADRNSTAVEMARELGQRLWVVRFVPGGQETQMKFSELPELNRLCAARPKYRKFEDTGDEDWKVYRLQEYMKVDLGILGGEVVTPKLLIKLLANKLGGVHRDRRFMNSQKVEDKKLAAIFRAGSSINIGPQSALTFAVDHLVTDTFHACLPLLHTLAKNGLVSEPSK